MKNGINRRQFGLMAGALAASTALAGTGARAAPSGRVVATIRTFNSSSSSIRR
jgi:putative spermidine/putrescine transport system substrate-binding protein